MAVNATAVYRIRTGGNDTNGGGFDAGIAGAGTDYSQQNSAQATGTNGACASSASTTFTDTTAANFTSAMVGNAIFIASGTNFTPGVYFVTGYTSSTTVTLDRSPVSAGAGSAGAWKLGGAWLKCDVTGNTNNSTWIVPGCTIYIRASGTGSVASPDYSLTANMIQVSGNNTNGRIHVIGENGRPYIQTNGAQVNYSFDYSYLRDLYFIGASNAIWNGQAVCVNCVFDQAGADNQIIRAQSAYCFGCEFLSSTPNTGTAGTSWVQTNNGTGGQNRYINCNFHDLWGNGLQLLGAGSDNETVIIDCLFSKISGDVLSLNMAANDTKVIYGCTFDANKGHAVIFNNADSLAFATIFNCIFSNHTGSGKYALNVNFSSTQAQNDRLRGHIDYNVFYGNTNDSNALTLGTNATAGGVTWHDTVGIDPQYVSASTENYAIGANVRGAGAPLAGNSLSGMAGTTTYLSPGAAQPAASGGATYVINRVTNIFTGDDYAP